MTARDRQRRRRVRRKDPARAILIAGGAIFCVIAVIVGAGFAYITSIANKVPPLSDLKVTTYGIASTVYDAEGHELGLIKSTILRQPVTEAEMPGYLRDATISIEDHNYYQHGAIDYLSLIRAAITDLTSGRTLQGGSTITMQLVRNLYPAVGDERSFSRKIKEAKVAEEFEAKHSKLWILTDYLNTVPYGTVGGQTAEGVQAASWMFFDHPAYDNTLAQSALLAGLPQAPTAYNPFYHPSAALARRNEVLAAMATYHYITPARASEAESKPLGVQPNTFYKDFHESYFIDFITQELRAKYGEKVLAAGDLKVYTTINPHLGSLAKNAITGVLDLPGDPSAALVSEDPHNGYVDTMGQSGSYAQSQYNLATQAQRQPGSTFKAIVLADALAHGIDPFTTTYLSHTLEPGWLPSVPTYTVSIDGGGSLNAPLNLDQALVASDNTVFAQLAADLGEQSVTQMAYAMGVVKGTLHSYPAEALGGLTIGVTPLEMANVYSTIADGGWRNKQITIRKVVFASGRVDRSWGIPHRTKVLSTAATAVETEILQHNVQYGTATLSAIGCPTAAKTGTTSGLVDAWLDGFTPNRTTVVWMGYEKANISMTDVHGAAQFGGLLPAQIWHDYMNQVVTAPCAQFANPASVPMTYVPFTGHYEEAGLAQRIPVSTGPSGPTGATGKSGKKHSNGGANAPPPTGHHHPTTTTPATTTPATTTPATTTPATTTPATTTPATTTPATTTPATTTPATTPPATTTPATTTTTPAANAGGAAAPPPSSSP
jgi:penicillin-binding protein 1A